MRNEVVERTRKSSRSEILWGNGKMGMDQDAGMGNGEWGRRKLRSGMMSMRIEGEGNRMGGNDLTCPSHGKERDVRRSSTREISRSENFLPSQGWTPVSEWIIYTE